METYEIAARFRGPPGTGNGGYVAGRAALLLGSQPAEVTLRRPVPLDRPLRVSRPQGGVAIHDEEGTLIVEAREAPLDLTVPPPPSRAEAEAATRWFLGSPHSHSGGLCFCCGSALAAGEGLRVFSGMLPDRPGVSAALWCPDPAFCGADGKVAPEFLWTALDCPGAFAFTLGRPGMRSLLGRLTGRVDGSVEPSEPCIVMGWRIAQEGRKLHAGTAIFGADGALRGIARALWVTPAPVAG